MPRFFLPRARRRAGFVSALLLALSSLLAVGAAHALSVTAFSPQGEVAHVRQVVAKFDTDAVRLGDPGAAAPFTLRCDHPAATGGQGRWVNARQWVYDFRADLPPGVRCQALPVAGFKSPAGVALSGVTSFRFNTGGPFVQSFWPGTSTRIEEEQIFVLRLNGPASTDSVRAHVWCALDGVGERVPIRLIEDAPRAALIKRLRLEQPAAAEPGRIQVLQCARRFTPDSQVQIVYGKGVSSPGGVASKIEQRLAFKVREPFTASTSCERENAQAACMPIRPIELAFSAPVARRWLEQARLRSDRAEFAPTLDEEGAPDDVLDRVRFAGPLPERSTLTLSLPAGLKDASGRALANAASFPLKIATGPLPPLAKFANSPFGIVERLAEGASGPALLPLTLRRVEPKLQASSLRLGDLQPRDDAEIIDWFTKVQRYDNWLVNRRQAQRDLRQPLPPPVGDSTRDNVEARTLSLLAGRSDVRMIEVPPAPAGGERPFEVVGVPLTPGFHVLEVSSNLLGQALLDPAYGATRPMVVRTSVLVTNLAVHFKLGRENALAWVTTLDKGRPVANATVQVSDCAGKPVARAVTDAQGIARFKDIPARAPRCADWDDDGYVGDFQQAWFVSARARSEGAPDMAFTWSSWQRGIEPWRFNVPTSLEPTPDVRAHTVFDRTLLRAGETVSMKHLIRTETAGGFGLPKARPGQLVITHVGSGQEYRQALDWRSTATGGLSAASEFAIPRAARLGIYQVAFEEEHAEPRESLVSGSFRVEEFRLPVLQGRVGPAGDAPLIAAQRVPVQVQVGYVGGGPAAGLPVRVSALTSPLAPAFEDYEEFSFSVPHGSSDEDAAARDTQLVADQLPAVLNAQGLAEVELAALKPAPAPRQLILEASYADPNGELQTLRGTRTLWPAGVVAGIKAERWTSVSQAAQVQALALDLGGKPRAGVPLDVRAVARTTTTTRKRMVGGFYAYESHTEEKDLGTVCTGSSDARGQLACKVKLTQPGEIELRASARDDKGHTALAATTVWVTRQGELWFGGSNDDRMDVLAEKKAWQPGDTARLQVRMPFRHATVLVAVEREGILHTEVTELRGDDPTIQLKIREDWGPNVYVSVLALRGRVHEVPWYSFFTWGYKAPREWWQAFWHDSKDFVPASALVDLSKPAFRLGMAELKVGARAHQLAVEVKADQPSYPVRGKAQLTIRVRQADGQPAAHAEVALAAVDQALLELKPNRSWELLEAMLQRRPWGVETATAQMEIIGRRHYGRKAVPAGGDGGASPTRELLDTLLLWRPRLQLDAQGQARVEVPLNDALTSFRIVAVADMGLGLFGTGATSIRTTQDLQIISGLPPLVREGDAFTATLTLRNTTQRAMKVEVKPRATLLALKPQTVELPAGQAREVHWDVMAPEPLAFTRAEALLWEVEAVELGGSARDRLKLNQRIVPAVPLTVRQASLTQLDAPLALDVAPPAGALPASGTPRGGLKLSLQPRLADGLPAIRDWFARYPYSCLEQQTSKAIGMDDHEAWQHTLAALPAYLDSNGLATYFPPQAGDGDRGSDTLTAWLLAATHEASQLDPAWRLPDEILERMITGLKDFVAGNIERKFWSPRADLDVRKLAAIEALARHDAASASMLTSITIAPRQWPTSAVIDWVSVLRRVKGIPEQPQRLAEAMQVLRARISVQGTRMVFATEAQDAWWWLMAGGDVNAARLLITVMQDPAWKDDLGRLVSGFIGRQNGGAWQTTTANLWGSLALREFSRMHEAQPVAGVTRATLAGQSEQVDWRQVKTLKADAATRTGRFPGAPAMPGQLTGNTLLLPWPGAASGAPLAISHSGSGKPWLTLQSLAAVELKAPFSAGYRIRKTITPVQQTSTALSAGEYSRGDILRVKLEVDASAPMTWVAITDPIPVGATILGSGLGRDSAIASRGERREGRGWPAFEERSFEAFRSYYEYLPKGPMSIEYTLRLNNAGHFRLPPSRVEAIYAPEMFGEAPNPAVTVRMP